MMRTLSGGRSARWFRFRAVMVMAPVAAALCLSTVSQSARADRIVLAPRGLITSAGAAKLEFASMLDRSRSNLGWVNVGVPDDALGLEVEAERSENPAGRRGAFSVQYSLTGNALSDIAPAVSVGIRDAANSGREGRALYVAMTKTMGLSELQERVIRDWKLHLGYGTSHMDGLYLGTQVKARPGFTISAEYYRRKTNLGIEWPIVGHLSAKAYSMAGEAYYGVAFAVTR